MLLANHIGSTPMRQIITRDKTVPGRDHTTENQVNAKDFSATLIRTDFCSLYRPYILLHDNVRGFAKLKKFQKRPTG